VTGTPLQSATYEPSKAISYFEQAFTKEAEIGAGYFGTVYRVRSKDDQRQYAVKIARERYRGPSDRARKLEEARKHQFLPPHSNLVRFYNSWEERGRLYQQFELCSQSLDELSNKQDNIPQDIIWAYLVDLLQAVQHLHDHDHIHMDIKPENIFIGMDGICKLGDFGLMLDLAVPDRGGIMEGDPKYLAPEVLDGRYTKACDVFSLGVTILELACDLDLPSSGELWHSLRRVGPDPSFTMHLQPELRRVVQLMMTQDESRRPTVRQLLELPSVQAAVRRRGRQLMLDKCHKMIMTVVASFLPLLGLLFSSLIYILSPLLSILPSSSRNPSTPPPMKVDERLLPAQAAIDAFSDDDEPDMLEVSSPDSDLASPLKHSDSSTTSRHSSNGCSTPRRSEATPPFKHRSRFLARTPNGTISPGKRLDFSVEDCDRSPGLGSLSSKKKKTNNDSDSDSDLMLAPQCLADTFDAFSGDDDF